MKSVLAGALVGLIGCGSSRAPSGTPPPPPPTTSDAGIAATPTLPPVPPPATIGALSSQRIAGPPTGVVGLVASKRGVEVLVDDHANLEVDVGRLAGGAWTFTAITAPGAIAGRIVARGDEVAVTVLYMTDDRLEVRWPDPGSDPHVVCDQPGITRHGLVLGADGPVIAHTCADELRITARAGGAWADRVISSEAAFVLDAAVDHLGAIHVMTSRDYLIADGDRVADGVLPPATRELEGIASCDGRVWGAFAIEGEGASTLSAGTWNGTAWELEPVPHPYIGPVVLGFDEACRPFLGIHERVFARGVDGWVGSDVPDAETVKGIAVRDGVLYAAFERIRNGVEVGIATAPVDLVRARLR